MGKFGFSFNWSWKRAFGISSLRQKIARKTGIPTTWGGLKSKVGSLVISLFKSVFSIFFRRKKK